MRRLFPCVVALAAALLVSCTVFVPHGITPTPAIKILAGQGHGSGFHIGGGYIVTAAHVAGSHDGIKIKTEDGETYDAETLWTNQTYDVALLKVDDASGLPVSEVSCRVPSIGEAISSTGNPGNTDFVTVWGKIAGAEREFGPWRSVVVTDIVTIPGQSGGPVYDEQGRVVGIMVGVLTVAQGFTRSITGIGYVVPSSSLCHLLARNV